MDVTFVTTAKTDEEGRELLRLLQMPSPGVGRARRRPPGRRRAVGGSGAPPGAVGT